MVGGLIPKTKPACTPHRCGLREDTIEGLGKQHKPWQGMDSAANTPPIVQHDKIDAEPFLAATA